MDDDMAGGAAHYLQLAVVHGTLTQALLLLLLPFLLLLLIARLLAPTTTTAKATQGRRRRSPPSPPGRLPVIGHLHLVGSMPHASLRDLAARHGRDGLLLLRLGAAPTLAVSSPAAAEAVLRTHDHVLASRPWSAVADIIFYGLTDVAFAPYGEHWRQARRLLTTHMLGANKVHSFRHARREEARLVVAKIRDAVASRTPAVDMSGLLSAYTNDVVFPPGPWPEQALVRADRDQRLPPGWIQPGGLLPELDEAGAAQQGPMRQGQEGEKEVGRTVRQAHRRARTVEQQAGRRQHCRLHTCLALCAGTVRPHKGYHQGHLDMFQAGIETSYLVLDYTMAELMINKHVMAKLQEEVRRCTPMAKRLDIVTEEDLNNMPYLKTTVKETLRLHPPVPLLVPHLSTADCEINGYFVPSATRIMVNAWALGRDPMSWEKPEEFMPERFLDGGSATTVDMKGKDFQFLPFGSGRRVCPGINFGISTVEIMLANLMYHFDWQLPSEMAGNGGGIDMTESFGLSLRRREKLLLVPRLLDISYAAQ
ncbi:hypothetical protein ACP70R_002732 [Stipagrostis hirtigluma subsp. patula]